MRINTTFQLIMFLGLSLFSVQIVAQKKEKSNKNNLKVNANASEPSLETLAKNTQPVVDEQQNGKVDWTNQYVEAKGQSILDTVRFKNKAQARAMAIRGAIVVAQRNLLEIVKGVNVMSETTVENMITTNDVINTKVEGVIKGAQMVGNPVESFGMIEVTMRVPLYQSNGIAAAVYDQVDEIAEKNFRKEGDENGSQLPPADNNNISAGNNDKAAQQYAFRLNGQPFDPALFPVVVDENNKILLDMSKIYDPKKGQFPKILQTTEEAFKQAGFKKGLEIIDVIKAQDGKLVVNEITKKKINWQKIGNIASKIGKFLLMLI